MAGGDSFLRTILRSGVIERGQLQEALRALPQEQRGDARQLADFLIAQGKLSRFQADKLLEGASRGLRLGPYVVQAPISRGGMGTVFLARDTRSQHYVALKVLPPKRAREEERLLARFRREMEMSQRVSHPHIAYTYETGVSEDVYYIAMEYIPGVSLHRLVVNEGPLIVSRAARLFIEVALALEYVHNQGLIHRDLKPSNIMVTPNDHAKVLDLGLALLLGEAPGDIEVMGGQGYVVGTMDFIAPEQTTDASAVDARADIYSLGCSLYFALTGRPPFPGGTAKEKILRHRREEPPPLNLVNFSVPDGFASLIHRMMAKDPGQRLPSAAAARQELLAWAQDASTPPLDQQGDVGYRQAVTALEVGAVPADLIGEVVILEAREDPSSEGRNGTRPNDQHDLGWLLGGSISLAVVVLAGATVAWLLG